MNTLNGLTVSTTHTAAQGYYSQEVPLLDPIQGAMLIYIHVYVSLLMYWYNSEEDYD